MTEYFIKPKAWIRLNLIDVIRKISTNKKKVKQKEYLESGSLPIIDQGGKYIGGYTNDFSKKIDCELPVIVFGDHTKIIKFINFDFAPGADGVKVIKPITCYEPKLFQFFLKVLVNRIPDKGYARHFQHIEKTKIPLPPLPEQNHIVSKIEELFSELDNGIESLKKAREQLKTYRQAVLKYAFEGKLTEEWRKKNKSGPAEKLLEQVKVERGKYYQQQLKDWKTACKQAKADGTKNPNKPKFPTNIDSKFSINKEYLRFLGKLPSSWAIVHIAGITNNSPDSIVDGPYGSSINVKNDYIEQGIPVIRINNILPFRFDPSNLKFLRPNKFKRLKRHNILSGDVLFSKVGTIGNSCIYPNNMPEGMLSTTGSCRIRIDNKLITTKFLCYLLNANKSTFNEIASAAVQAFLNMMTVKNFPIPLPSLGEQQAIVQEIESRLSVCDKIEQIIEDSLKKAEALRQSVLKKAFAGELTKDWRKKHPELIAGENSAEKLLEKIKAEKALVAGRKKTRSKKMKKSSPKQKYYATKEKK